MQRNKKKFDREFSKKLPQGIQRLAMRKLLMLNAASEIHDLCIPPSNRLEPLSGNRRGLHSIRINQQRRICFKWSNGCSYDVEIIDYH